MATPQEMLQMVQMQAQQVQQQQHMVAQVMEALTKMMENQTSSDKWDSIEKYKNIKLFSGKQDDWEEFSRKTMGQIGAGRQSVVELMDEAALEATESDLMNEDWNVLTNTALDNAVVGQISAKLHHLLSSLTTGEANAVVWRCQKNGLLAWRRLSTSLNPRTLASGVKAISVVLNPGKITNAMKADHAIDAWEDNMEKLVREYGETITAKMRVAVLYSMLPKDLQERVLDKCAVAWEGAKEEDAKLIFSRIREEVKNVAKSRRDMASPKPMEVDEVTGELRAKDEADDNLPEPQDVNYVGNGKGKGRGCWTCGDPNHRQANCPRNQGKGQQQQYQQQPQQQQFNRGGGGFQNPGKGGGGWLGQSSQQMLKACFTCGSLNHLARHCPQNPNGVPQQQRVNEVTVEGDQPEVLHIGHTELLEEDLGWHRVGSRWTRNGRGVQIGGPPGLRPRGGSRFEALREECDVCHVRVAAQEIADVATEKVGGKEQCWASLGVGEITVDSAAEESCWPVDQGGAFETKPSKRNILLKTANGAEMKHYGEKDITFRGSGNEVVGLKFQVTDVRKPLLAVRRLVEKGNVVMFGPEPHQNYIHHVQSGQMIPMERRGGSFVIKAHFVKELAAGFTRQG